jgi:hypothetical protein
LSHDGGKWLAKCQKCGKDNDGGAEYCVYCGGHLGQFRTCGDCGVVNQPDAAACRMCGADLDSERKGSRSVSAERPGYRPKFRTCSKCGGSYDNHLVECPHCERKVSDTYDPTMPRSSIPMAAGVLLVIAGFLCIMNGVFFGSLGGISAEFAYCGFVEIIMGVVAVVGWIFCMQRANLPLVIVAAVVAMLSVGPFFISSLLGFIALILIAVSAKEFR